MHPTRIRKFNIMLFVNETSHLSDLVRDVMKEKGLSTYDVARNCKFKITAATVSKILNREIKSNSLDTLVALAEGLGISDTSVFRAARGLPPETPTERLEILAETFDGQELSDSDWKEIEGVIKIMIEQKKAIAHAFADKKPPRSNFKRKTTSK